MFSATILVQFTIPKGAPYDSTQGVPDYVFIGFWIILIALGLRIAWDFRDKLYPKALKLRDKVFPKAATKPANKKTAIKK